MKDIIIKELKNLVTIEHHHTETIIKKIILVCGFFANGELPDEIKLIFEKAQTHLSLIEQVKNLSRKIDEIVAKDIKIQFEDRTHHHREAHEVNNSLSFTFNIGTINLEVNNSQLFEDFREANKSLAEFQINYPLLIGWAVERARELDYIE